MRDDERSDAARLRARMFFEQGRHYYNARKFDNALTSFEKAIEADPGFTRAYTSKAHALVYLEKPREALAVCDTACSLDPQSPYPYVGRAVALAKLGRTDEAEKEYERALAVAPQEDMVFYNYACFWATVGNEEKCRVNLEQAIRLDPRFNSTAAVDDDFAPYRDREWFQTLVAFKRRH